MADAESTLRELLDKILHKLGYSLNDAEIKAMTTGGANYSSVLFLITVATPSKPELNLFAKVANFGENIRETMGGSILFKTEEFVYGKLSKIYSDLQAKHQVPEEDRFVFPKFYGSNQELYKETVVLENLVAKGYKLYSRFESIDWEYASAAVKALANLHALSFAYQKERPDEFDRVTREYNRSIVQVDEKMKEMFENMLKRSMALLKNETLVEKVSKFMAENENLYETCNSPIGKPVLVHGDYRPSNLMYKKIGSSHHVIPVDYQTLYAGCPVTDLVYFIFLGSDGAFRKSYYNRLIDHYYQQLSNSMKRLGLDSTEVYSREKFDSDLKEMLPYAIFLGIMALPIILVDEENAPNMGEAASDITSMFVQANDLYAERFREIVDDCVKWGVI